MIDVIKWWRASFDRDSLDDNGMTVKVITHKSGMTDNASWSNSEKLINVYDASDNARSDAAAVDVMAHESTHAVIMYTIGDDFAKNYKCNVSRATGNGIATGAINEGYADIFGCLMTGQWKHALHVYSDDRHERNIEDPTDGSSRQNQKVVSALRAPASLQEVREPYMYEGEIYDHGGVHINSSLVSYPAYLMHQDHNPENGLTWNELGKLWYKSMRMGYSATSTFKTVRTCVMRAARKLNMPEGKISAIVQAFKDVGIDAEKCILQGTVSKYGGGALYGIRVTANKQTNGIMYMSVLTDAEGHYSMDLYADTYTVNIDASGYVPFSAVKQVEEGADNILDISLLGTNTQHSYRIFTESATWEQAKARCEEVGGHLATITSEEEYNQVLGMIPSGTYAYYWLGATKDDVSGMWQWITGEPFIFMMWQDGEPNNQGGIEQCLELTNAWYPYEDWGWNDENGDFEATGFVCEWDSVVLDQ